MYTSFANPHEDAIGEEIPRTLPNYEDEENSKSKKSKIKSFLKDPLKIKKTFKDTLSKKGKGTTEDFLNIFRPKTKIIIEKKKSALDRTKSTQYIQYGSKSFSRKEIKKLNERNRNGIRTVPPKLRNRSSSVDRFQYIKKLKEENEGNNEFNNKDKENKEKIIRSNSVKLEVEDIQKEELDIDDAIIEEERRKLKNTRTKSKSKKSKKKMDGEFKENVVKLKKTQKMIKRTTNDMILKEREEILKSRNRSLHKMKGEILEQMQQSKVESQKIWGKQMLEKEIKPLEERIERLEKEIKKKDKLIESLNNQLTKFGIFEEKFEQNEKQFNFLNQTIQDLYKTNVKVRNNQEIQSSDSRDNTRKIKDIEDTLKIVVNSQQRRFSEYIYKLLAYMMSFTGFLIVLFGSFVNMLRLSSIDKKEEDIFQKYIKKIEKRKIDFEKRSNLSKRYVTKEDETMESSKSTKKPQNTSNTQEKESNNNFKTVESNNGLKTENEEKEEDDEEEDKDIKIIENMEKIFEDGNDQDLEKYLENEDFFLNEEESEEIDFSAINVGIGKKRRGRIKKNNQNRTNKEERGNFTPRNEEDEEYSGKNENDKLKRVNRTKKKENTNVMDLNDDQDEESSYKFLLDQFDA